MESVVNQNQERSITVGPDYRSPIEETTLKPLQNGTPALPRKGTGFGLCANQLEEHQYLIRPPPTHLRRKNDESGPFLHLRRIQQQNNSVSGCRVTPRTPTPTQN